MRQEPLSTIRAVFFDFGDTLFDSRISNPAAERAALHEALRLTNRKRVAPGTGKGVYAPPGKKQKLKGIGRYEQARNSIRKRVGSSS